MRTFALYERRTSIFSILFVAWITAVAVAIVSVPHILELATHSLKSITSGGLAV